MYYLAQIESIVNSDDSLFLDEGFSVHFIIFDGSQKPLPSGYFSDLHFDRPKSKYCGEIAKYVLPQRCSNFHNLLKAGIIDLTLLSAGNCLITSLAFGVFLHKNKLDVKFCLKRIFQHFHKNLQQFSQEVLGNKIFNQLNSSSSLHDALNIFCKETDYGVIMYNLEDKIAKVILRKNVKLSKTPIYILYQESQNHIAFLYDLAIR